MRFFLLLLAGMGLLASGCGTSRWAMDDLSGVGRALLAQFALASIGAEPVLHDERRSQHGFLDRWFVFKHADGGLGRGLPPWRGDAVVQVQFMWCWRVRLRRRRVDRATN